jgi:hypothetical protein
LFPATMNLTGTHTREARAVVLYLYLHLSAHMLCAKCHVVDIKRAAMDDD